MASPRKRSVSAPGPEILFVRELSCSTNSFSFVFSASYRSGLVVLKTTTLLQLWLQPPLQGYPPFEDFPRLYEETVGLLAPLSGKERLSRFDLLQTAARAVDEFFNVRNGTEHYIPWIKEAKKFTGRRKIYIFIYLYLYIYIYLPAI